MTNKRAQSTLEYILVLVVILLAMLAAFASKNSPIRTGLKNFFDELGNTVGGVMDEFKP